MNPAIWYLLAMLAVALVVALWPEKRRDLDSFTVITLLIESERKSRTP